mgnify:FL=1
MQDRLIEEAFYKYKDYLTAVIKTVGKNISDADVDDILSDIYLKLCRTSQIYDEDKASVKTYLSYIARNATIDFCRKIKITDENIDEHEEIHTDENLEGYILRVETAELVKEALGQLDKKERDVFIMFYYFENTIDEISMNTGMKSSTIKSVLRRGRAKLKKHLNGKGYEFEN